MNYKKLIKILALEFLVISHNLFLIFSTAYTDSDADYESGKPQQRKSKPEKKKKRTTNLGPRVRVMNSTAITDSGGDVSEVKLECHLEVKSEDSCGKTLTFEFSYPDVDPDEISHEFVSLNIVDVMEPCTFCIT